MTLHPRGVNHLAIATCDMKSQIEFFSDVLGLPLKALYWMHGAQGVFHGFLELSPESYIALVQHPENIDKIDWGFSHAGSGLGPMAAGGMQHVAFHADSFEEVLELRDRIRSRGVQVLGPIDHGFVQSMYFAGPEGLSLEICCGTDIDERAWIDPEVVDLCGISSEEVEAFKHPADYTRPSEAIPQPPTRLDKPRMHFQGPAAYDDIMFTPDQEVWERRSETTPPVKVD